MVGQCLKHAPKRGVPKVFLREQMESTMKSKLLVVSIVGLIAHLVGTAYATTSVGITLNGGELSSATSWVLVTNAAPWSGGGTPVALGGKMWLLGTTAGSLNDVWFSTNGLHWIQATSNAAWSARGSTAAVAHNGQMWVLGGYGADYLNDVWSSPDGINWTQATNTAPWLARGYGHAVVAVNGRMWILGGWTHSGRTHDVWSSADGVNWTLATNAAPWSARLAHAAVAFNGQMWVLGGNDGPGSYRSDIWSSADGVTWTQATNAAP